MSSSINSFSFPLDGAYAKGPDSISSWEDIRLNLQLGNLLAITHMSCSIWAHNSSFLVVEISFPPKVLTSMLEEEILLIFSQYHR